MCSTRKGKEKDLYPECKKNHEKHLPVNQIIPGRDIYYIVGKQTIDARLRSKKHYGEVLYDLPKAQKAFNHQSIDPWKKDLGLLIVDIADWDNLVLHNIVRPLKLPDKG